MAACVANCRFYVSDSNPPEIVKFEIMDNYRIYIYQQP